MSDLKRFRDELPFGDDVLRGIRSDLMKQIEREPRRDPSSLGILFRMSFAAIVLIVFAVWQTGELPSRPVVETPSRRAATVPVVAPVHQPVIIASNPSETRKLEDPATPKVRRAARRRTRITRRAPQPAFAEPAAVRIELHTSNPDIRILWINQSSGETR